VLVIIGRGTNR